MTLLFNLLSFITGSEHDDLDLVADSISWQVSMSICRSMRFSEMFSVIRRIKTVANLLFQSKLHTAQRELSLIKIPQKTISYLRQNYARSKPEQRTNL